MPKADLLDSPVPEPQALAPTSPDQFVSVVERLAANPDVDVTKLEKIIELQERVLRHNAKAAFDAAFSAMQPAIPVVAERGKTDKGTYAELEDIVEVLRPILAAHGFALSHRTEWPDKQTVKVVGILTHRDGHQRESEFLSSADTSGSKNAIQALGSAVSYGRRYTTKDLLNIVTRREDDDARRSGLATLAPPAGYDDWLLDMQAVADEGYDAFVAAWGRSRKDFRDYVNKHDQQAINALRVTARKGQA